MATTDFTVTATPDGRTVTVLSTPVLETSQLDALDAAHTNSVKLIGMARVNGGSGTIRRATLISKPDVGTALKVHLFTAETTQTADAAFAPTDAQAATYIGTLDFVSFEDFDTSRVSSLRDIALAYKCAAGDTALYYTIQVPAGLTPTYTDADGINVVFLADRD